MSISLPYGKLYHTIKNNKEEFNPRMKKREKKMYKTTTWEMDKVGKNFSLEHKDS